MRDAFSKILVKLPKLTKINIKIIFIKYKIHTIDSD